MIILGAAVFRCDSLAHHDILVNNWHYYVSTCLPFIYWYWHTSTSLLLHLIQLIGRAQMSILSISLIFHELNYIKESSEETIIRVPYEDRMHVSGLYKNGMARNFHAINQTQEWAWANVIRLFLTCHQANQGCCCILCRKYAEGYSAMTLLSLSAYQNQYFDTKETNWRKAE